MVGRHYIQQAVAVHVAQCHVVGAGPGCVIRLRRKSARTRRRGNGKLVNVGVSQQYPRRAFGGRGHNAGHGLAGLKAGRTWRKAECIAAHRSRVSQRQQSASLGRINL